MLYNMKEILAVAKEHKFAIPAFNVADWSMFLGIMDECEATNSPVIIEIHPDELAFEGPDMVGAIRQRALKSKVPVCIHLDHCSNFGTIIEAIQCGFTSVMFDGASLPFEENIAGAKKVVEAAHPVNVSVEAELGTIGSTNPDDLEGGAAQIIYTDPDDAVKFVEATGVDTLAVAIGTAHGFYVGTPVLDKERLSEIREVVDIPLVLHGASGLSDEDVMDCVKRGICKVNFATELRAAYSKAVKDLLTEKPDTIDPKAYGKTAIAAVKELVMARMKVCGCDGKAE